MKKGMSLLELVAALAVASIIVTLLYQAVTQSSRLVVAVDATMDAFSSLGLFRERIIKDLSGAFIPVTAQRVEEDEEEQKEAPVKGLRKPKKKPKALKNIFVIKDMSVSGEKKKQGLFTLISSNPMIVYNEVSPRRVRILYKLEPQKERSGYWVLKRYESSTIELDDLAKPKGDGFEILSDIKKFSIEVLYRKKDKEAAKFEFKKSWGAEEEEKNMLPDYVKINGAVGARERKQEVPFSFMIPISASQAPPKKVARFAAPPNPTKRPNLPPSPRIGADTKRPTVMQYPPLRGANRFGQPTVRDAYDRQ